MVIPISDTSVPNLADLHPWRDVGPKKWIGDMADNVGKTEQVDTLRAAMVHVRYGAPAAIAQAATSPRDPT